MGNTEIKAKKPQSVKSKISWVFAVILVVVIILLMALPTSGFGLLATFSHRNDYVFGYFGGKKIDYSENSYLKRNYENLERSYSQYINESNRDYMSMFIWQQAFQNAAVMTALDYMAEKTGVVISDERVDNEITRLLTDENGNFQRDYWASLSASDRRNIRELVKSDLVRMQVVNDVSDAPIPQGEIDALKTLDSYKESTDSAVKTSIKDGTTSRLMSAVLASPLYKDNFMDVYNKRINPPQEEEATTTTEESEAQESTENENVQNESTQSDESVTTENLSNTEVKNNSSSNVVTTNNTSSSTSSVNSATNQTSDVRRQRTAAKARRSQIEDIEIVETL